MSHAPTPAPVIAIPAPVLRILERLEAAGHETWCVGGAIRDALLGDPQQDVDLATAALPADVRRLFPRTVPVGLEHGTVGVLDEDGVLHEVTTFRRDVRTDGRHAEVEFGVSLDDDLGRRDFTINAIAWHPVRGWRDPHGGREDIAARMVRAVGDPAARFREDRLRILRALRFAARFGFAIAPATWEAARAQAGDTRDLSAERVREEWWKGVRSARDPRALVTLWRDAGVAAAWFAESEVRCDPLPDLDPAIARDPVLLLAAWRTPVAPLLRRLKASGADIGRARGIDRGPAEPVDPTPVAVRQWMAAVGSVAAARAPHAAIGGGREPAWVATWREVRARGDATSRAELAIGGDELVAAGIAEPGPALGRLLDRLLDAVLRDPELNAHDRLLALAREAPP